ncbi:MAG: PKD domain-containing protein [Planctomycetes bacterium]|nr:PKD domain-containing protein [Planctomycetota bacterium]MBL7039362.1 PKD domain-containing protein [Pirellulaceae bacterium]
MCRPSRRARLRLAVKRNRRTASALLPVRLACTIVLATCMHGQANAAEVIELQAKDTITALEMNHGDTCRFALRNGQTRTLVLLDTSAAIVERVEPGGIVYRFDCRIQVDGQPLTMRRYACSQECFYEPYVVNGMRIWPDIVKDVFDLIPVRYPKKGNLQCVPRKDARFAIHDATLRICPEETRPWLDERQNYVDVSRCYNGDDCYLGPYLGQACHVGMDINHPKGSLLFAPISFDTHAYFNSLKAGHNNNRWRGIRRWPNGDVWALQTHHLIKLLVPEDTSLSVGTEYATTAGVHVGSHEHTHFEFKVGRPRRSVLPPLPLGEGRGEGPSRTEDPHPNLLPGGKGTSQPTSSIAFPIDFDDQSELAQERPEVLHLDPWIVFWQIFEDRKSRDGKIRATIAPLSSCQTGQLVTFSPGGSRPGANGAELSYYWTFGDGGFAIGPKPQHAFARSGVYPATLVVDDGTNQATSTQHITVNGESVVEPVLALSAPDEIAFRRRPVPVADVYGTVPRPVPHALEFVARSTQPVPRTKTIRLENLGGGTLPAMKSPSIVYLEGADWLMIEPSGKGNGQSLSVRVDATGLSEGGYTAEVNVVCSGAVNSPQSFRIVLRVPSAGPAAQVTIDDRDDACYATPYFWVGHRFCRCPKGKRGHGSFYLTNGSRSAAGEFVRFTPDLLSGRYEVALADETPFRLGTEFGVRVRHRDGDSIVRVVPSKSQTIGTFDFDEGTDGFVEILAEGSKGLVIADAVHLRRVAD